MGEYLDRLSMYVRKGVRGGEGVSESRASVNMTSAFRFGMFGRILLKSHINRKGKAGMMEIVEVAVVAMREDRKLFVDKVSKQTQSRL